MAFGKKGKRDDETPNSAAEAADDNDALPEAVLGTVGPETDAAAPVDAPDVEAAEPAPTAGTPAGDGDALSADLLNVFQSTQIEQHDLSVILELAGDVDLDDLLEQLHTVAVALGCDVEQYRAA